MAKGSCRRHRSGRSRAGSIENFYYAQEDEVFAAAARNGFSWSVHRPHTVIGMAVGSAMNMGTTLATYATLCRETGRPFLFPGSAAQWSGLTDMTDAGQLARHLLWATETDAAHDDAFNVVNGDVFRWQWMWSRIAEWFGLAVRLARAALAIELANDDADGLNIAVSELFSAAAMTLDAIRRRNLKTDCV